MTEHQRLTTPIRPLPPVVAEIRRQLEQPTRRWTARGLYVR